MTDGYFRLVVRKSLAEDVILKKIFLRSDKKETVIAFQKKQLVSVKSLRQKQTWHL